MDLFLRDIAAATGGNIIGEAAGRVSGVSVDSRVIKKGEAFFALKGPHFDGHEFIEDAEKKGAACAVVRRGARYTPRGGFPVIEVDDTLSALGKLARFVRVFFRAPLVAISGSCGKTATKEMIADILGRERAVLKTSGNMNNLVGLSLTLLSLNGNHDAVVAELGISEKGEMERLAHIARPDISVLTNIGAAHCEGLGGVDGVREEKLKLFEATAGVRVFNLDDSAIERFARNCGGEKITFSAAKRADVVIKGYTAIASVKAEFGVRGKTLSVEIPSPLVENIYNAAAACSVALSFGASLEEMKQGLESFNPLKGRMTVVELGRWTVIDDTYSANPESVKAAIAALKGISANRRTVAILGDMAELGGRSESAHREVGRFAAEARLDAVISVGGWGRAVSEGALSGGLKNVFPFGTKKEAMSALFTILRDGDVVLVKGSRSSAMEEIVQELERSR